MGLCISCDGSAGVCASETAEPATAKVIFPDGRLEEYCGGVSVRASRVLVHKDLSPPSAFFLCSADDLDAEGRVATLANDEELEPGQIYFVLPVHMLKRPLLAEEMAKLAVMAAGALAEVGGVIAQGNPYEDLEAEEKKMMRRRKTAPGPAGRRRNRMTGGGGRGMNFTPNLTAIPE